MEAEGGTDQGKVVSVCGGVTRRYSVGGTEMLARVCAHTHTRAARSEDVVRKLVIVYVLVYFTCVPWLFRCVPLLFRSCVHLSATLAFGGTETLV